MLPHDVREMTGMPPQDGTAGLQGFSAICKYINQQTTMKKAEK